MKHFKVSIEMQFDDLSTDSDSSMEGSGSNDIDKALNYAKA